LDLEALEEVLYGLRIVTIIVVDTSNVVEGGGSVDASLPLDPLLDLEALEEVLYGLRIVALIVVDISDVVEGGGSVDASLPLDPLLDLEALGEVFNRFYYISYQLILLSFFAVYLRY
jgi:hypothetical protein